MCFSLGYRKIAISGVFAILSILFVILVYQKVMTTSAIVEKAITIAASTFIATPLDSNHDSNVQISFGGYRGFVHKCFLYLLSALSIIYFGLSSPSPLSPCYGGRVAENGIGDPFHSSATRLV